MSPALLEPPISKPPIEPLPAGRESRRRFDRILVPVDCDARSRRFLVEAAEVARRFGAEVILLHVYDPLDHAPAHTTALEMKDWQNAVHERAEVRLRELVRESGEDAIISTARRVTTEGFPERTICELARELEVGLIVVSTHGHCGFERLFLGSKAEWIVRHAPCPVLVIPVREVG